MTSTLEATFSYLLRALAPDLPEPEAEYRFHPTRKWRFDIAWPIERVAVELDGGVYSGGRHTRGAGFVKDCEKLNEATVRGWRILRYTTDMLQHEPEIAIAQVRALLEER